MSKPLYTIKNWNENYEIAQSRRKTGDHKWVAIPNKHDGKSFRRLIGLKDGIAVYGAWCLIVQIASKCPSRGVLADEDGPLDAEDMAIKTGAPIGTFDRALQVCSSERVAWLSVARSDDGVSEVGAQSERDTTTLPYHTIHNITIPLLSADADFDSFWEAFPSRRKTAKGKAREAWRKAIKKSPAAEIIGAASEYAASDVGRGEFAVMPATWLNGECWLDDRKAWTTQPDPGARLPTEADLANWRP